MPIRRIQKLSAILFVKAFKKTETALQTPKSSGLFPPIVGANGNAPFHVADYAGQGIERNDTTAQMIARMMRSLDFVIETNLPGSCVAYRALNSVQRL